MGTLTQRIHLFDVSQEEVISFVLMSLLSQALPPACYELLRPAVALPPKTFSQSFGVEVSKRFADTSSFRFVREFYVLVPQSCLLAEKPFGVPCCYRELPARPDHM